MTSNDSTEPRRDDDPSRVVDWIVDLFHRRGDASYIGEAVTQTQHALQAGELAQQAGASDELITAAILHDIGHLLHNLPEDIADQGIDDRHEALGERFVARHFSPLVAEAVQLHVDAKRYLCATETGYLSDLSAASQKSLALQGGVFDDDQVQHFESHRFWPEAVQVRRWDDRAKDPNRETPPWSDFRESLLAAASVTL
ncbi:MAG: HD domain-containing protein [Pirellulaceae bacterium]|jgi:phosphonate degradation associated HDIG domain protein|nr:HD domain-containing protein [Pirellulaceae bacterium]MDP7016446.1 HD domain-containing protein [Pirellulaceae bacterium]